MTRHSVCSLTVTSFLNINLKSSPVSRQSVLPISAHIQGKKMSTTHHMLGKRARTKCLLTFARRGSTSVPPFPTILQWFCFEREGAKWEELRLNHSTGISHSYKKDERNILRWFCWTSPADCVYSSFYNSCSSAITQTQTSISWWFFGKTWGTSPHNVVLMIVWRLISSRK